MIFKTLTKKEKMTQKIPQKRYTSRFKSTWLLMLLLTAFLWQCKKDDYKGETKGICPEVILTDPLRDAINVVINKKVTATFNEAMDPATITGTTYLLKQGTNAIAGAVTYSGIVATFSPSTPLTPFTLYSATVTKAAKDPRGNALKADYLWSFTTQPMVTLSSSPAAGGTVIGAGAVNNGSVITVVAMANPGFSFLNWTEAGNIVSTSSSYLFTVNGNRTLVANFTSQFVVALSANPLAGGVTSGGGAFNSGATVTAVATSNLGYLFANWTEAGLVVSTLANYPFTLSGNRTLVANFTAQFTLGLSSNPLPGGTTTGGGLYSSGSLVTATAIPNVGYTFKNWTEAGNIVSTNAVYPITLTGNRILVANFSAPLSVTLISNPLNGGTTSGGGAYNAGASVTAAAVPNPGFVFGNWSEAGVIVSTDANYLFTISGNRTLTANFIARYNIVTSGNPLLGGTTRGDGTFDSGSPVAALAFPNPGYVFTNWTEAGQIVSTLAVYPFTISGNRTLVANFGTQNTITLVSNPLAGGTTLGGGIYNSGTQVSAVATANPGYQFTNWTEAGVIVSTLANYPFMVSGNRTLTANFATQVSLTLNAVPLEGGKTNGGGLYGSGTLVYATAVPNLGYNFKNWTEAGNILSNIAIYPFILNSNRTLEANFVAQYTLALSSNPLNGGTTVGSGTYDSGALVLAVALAKPEFQFTNWTEGGVIVSTLLTYPVTLTGNRTLVANFVPKIVIMLSSNPLAGGKTAGSGSYNSGANIFATAVPNSGFVFKNWTEAGNIVSTNDSYPITVVNDRTLVANFLAKYSVITTATPFAGGQANGGGIFTDGASVTVSATTNPGYTFTNWKDGANILTTNASYTFILNNNRNLTANFTLNPVAVVCPTIVDLGLAKNYVILAKSGISTTGATSITGDLGIDPAAAGSITGFGLILAGAYSTSALVTGKVYASDYAVPTPANILTARLNMETAYTTAYGLVVPAPVTELLAGSLSGQTLTKGIYKWSTAVNITGGITLDGAGDPCATFIFQIAGDLIVNPGAVITLTPGTDPKNIFWVVAGSKAALDTGVDFKGNILCLTKITVNTGATVKGRLLAQTAVTLDANTITMP